MNLIPITLAPVFPIWLILVLFCGGGISALLQYKRIRDRLGKPRAMFLSLLRLAAVCLIVAFALNPSLVTRKVHKVSPAVAVIVDTSWSMGQPTAGDKGSRLDEARAVLTKGMSPVLNALAQEHEVTLYGLTDSLVTLTPEELDGIKAGGNKGDLNAALKALSHQNAVSILLSDGKLQWHQDHPNRCRH